MNPILRGYIELRVNIRNGKPIIYSGVGK